MGWPGGWDRDFCSYISAASRAARVQFPATVGAAWRKTCIQAWLCHVLDEVGHFTLLITRGLTGLGGKLETMMQMPTRCLTHNRCVTQSPHSPSILHTETQEEDWAAWLQATGSLKRSLFRRLTVQERKAQLRRVASVYPQH